jgi:hypothetical protein
VSAKAEKDSSLRGDPVCVLSTPWRDGGVRPETTTVEGAHHGRFSAEKNRGGFQGVRQRERRVKGVEREAWASCTSRNLRSKWWQVAELWWPNWAARRCRSVGGVAGNVEW